MNVLYKVGLVVIGIAVLFGVGFAAGHTWCTSGQQGAIHDSIEDGAEKVEQVKEVIKWREKKVNVYVDRIKTIVDNTGCADVAISAEHDDELYEIYKITRGPEAHRRLPVRELPGTNTTGDTPDQ